MSNRAAEYREIIGDLVASGLLDEDERAELSDMLARVERKILASMPAQGAHEAAE
jgi:hypothetical protein